MRNKPDWEIKFEKKFYNRWQDDTGFVASFTATTDPEEYKNFIRNLIQSERKQAVDEVRDIIINWEKVLKNGGLKTGDGSWINLSYLLGKIN